MTGKELAQVLNKFLTSPAAQNARVQIELPNGEYYDIVGAQLMENRLIGTKDSHRLVLKCQKPTEPMGKIITKL